VFRQFMMVCWVLFALSGLAGVAGWIGNSIYASRILDIRPYGMVLGGVTDPYTILNELRRSERRAFHRLVEERNGAKKLPEGNVVEQRYEFDTAPAMDVEARERIFENVAELHARASEYYSFIQGFTRLGIVGSMLAAILALWNIIWHTGHWVWMGRKTA